MSRIAKGLVAALALCAIVAGTSAAWAGKPPRKPICECAPIDLPVLCPDGKVYGSPCLAGCAGQTDCVPTGGGGGIN